MIPLILFPLIAILMVMWLPSPIASSMKFPQLRQYHVSTDRDKISLTQVGVASQRRSWVCFLGWPTLLTTYGRVAVDTVLQAGLQIMLLWRRTKWQGEAWQYILSMGAK